MQTRSARMLAAALLALPLAEGSAQTPLSDRPAITVTAFEYGAVASQLSGDDLGAKHSSTTVHLTARVVDTRTGEIIGSFTGEGVSKKRWGVTVFGIGRGGLGGGKVADANLKETAIGEATTRAAAAIVERVIALRATRLRP